VGKRRIVLGLFCLGLTVLSCVAVAAPREITYVTVERDGMREVEVETPLARLILSEQGGVMKSAFVSFAPYGSSVSELVPGTTTNVKTFGRQYVADAIFPFALSVNGEQEGRYQLVDVGVDATTGVFRAVFRGNVAGTSIEKRYTIAPDAVYTIGFEIVVDNPTAAAAQVQMTVGNYVQKKAGGLEITYLFDGQPGTQLLARESYQAFGGVGLMDKQTVFFLSPGKGAALLPTFERTASGSQHFGVAFTAAAGTATSAKSTLYGGRRRFLLMQEAGLQALDRPGVGARLMIPVIQFIDILFRATGNYGWAIILFTILSRVLLYPLMNKQMHSMAKLQRLQPKMKRVQARFKDDKQLLQQRMMELYKKEGINPMSGCLPMVIQLPIIFIIWRAILYAGERIHLSAGFLWMPDLSLYDPYFILVILTTAIMIVQQWLLTPQTGSDGGPGAKYFGYVFPVLMAILMWQFPAGLWLYYLLTTGAQAAQQALVNRQLARSDRLTAATSEGDLELGDGDDPGPSQAGS
jgi:YidC/Oxa1 family membrane protein insertase